MTDRQSHPILQSIHFRLAVTVIIGLLLVTGVNLALFAYFLGGLPGDAVSGTAGQDGGLSFTASALITAAGLNLAVVVLVAGLLGVILKKNLLTPLEQLASYAMQVAGGDLEAKPVGRFIGRLLTLRNSIESMVTGLKDEMARSRKKADEAHENAAKAQDALWRAERMHRKDEAKRQGLLGAGETLEGVADNIKKATDDLGGEAGRVSQGAQEQQDHVQSTVEAMDEMLRTIAEVAESAASASEAAVSAKAQAESGASVVDESIGAIGQVRELATTLKEKMSELGSQADSIGRVMTVISDIADQTNLLALNAAIEAARAGDAGRGFAVVADEVRKLAEKTMAATSEVGSLISAIQKGTFENIKAMDKAAEAVEEATDLAGRSGEALGEIVRLVESTSSRVETIGRAVHEQEAAGMCIKDAVDMIHEISTSTTEGMVRSTSTIEKLGGEIVELMKLNGVFRLIGEGTAQDAVERMAESDPMTKLNREPMEKLMTRAIKDHPFFELLYATDAKGVQVTENIAPASFTSLHQEAVRGRDWSSRSWFTGAAESGETFISPIYVSEASGEYCLTISTPIWRGREMAGVLAADIKVFG